MQISHNQVIQDLESLGLSHHEAEIYFILVRSGEVSAGKVLAATGFHREQVYRALKRLVDQGLATKYKKDKRGTYAPVNPNVLTQKALSKVDTAKTVVPYLEQLRGVPSQLIRVAEGGQAMEGLFEDIDANLSEGGEYLVLGGAGSEFYELSKVFLSKYHRRFAKKSILTKIIVFEGEDLSKELTTGKHIQARVVVGQYGAPAPATIYGKKVAIEILDPDNPAIITIENEKIAEAYKKMFQALWRIAKHL